MARYEPGTPTATASSTGTGMVQLSYRATREQIGEQHAARMIPGLARRSLLLVTVPVHS